MTGQNDRQDRSLTGQVHDQAGHCPLTGRYLQLCECRTPNAKCQMTLSLVVAVHKLSESGSI